MDDLTFEILRVAVRIAKDEQIKRLAVLRKRLAQLYPDAAPQRDAAINAWTSQVLATR